MWSRKRLFSHFLLIVNNVNTCNKPKNASDLMLIAVYCNCLVQFKIVFVWIPNSLLRF